MTFSEKKLPYDMDSQHAENLLMGFFKENSYYESSEHFEKIILISENKNADAAATQIALDKFEELGIVKPKKVNEKTYHVLTKPIDSWEQQVEIGSYTALAISDCINAFCDVIGDYKDKCTASEIQPKDIHNLTFIIQHYKSVACGDLEEGE